MQMKAGNASARSPAAAILEGNEDSGAVKQINYPGSYNAYNTRMPLAGGKDYAFPVRKPRRPLHLGQRIAQDLLFELLSFGIAGVKQCSDFCRFSPVVAQQKFHPEGRVLEPSSRIEARCKPETHRSAADLA